MVTIENLNFSYPGHEVFNNISLNLESGKIYGLLGQNGVGKTTLLKIISGLLKLSKGTCQVSGHNPFKREPSFLNSLYFIPEDYASPDIEINKYATMRGRFYPGYDPDKFLQLLKDFDVDGNKKFTKQSYGQQKKAIISFALATNSRLILMDEPSNGLDIPSKAQLRKVISQAADENSCIVISTHQVRDLENLIDPIIILDRNGVLLNESIESISGKLHFSFSAAPVENSLYQELTLGGYLTVNENKDSLESKVNIEALFNAVLQNRNTIMNLFKN